MADPPPGTGGAGRGTGGRRAAARGGGRGAARWVRAPGPDACAAAALSPGAAAAMGAGAAALEALGLRAGAAALGPPGLGAGAAALGPLGLGAGAADPGGSGLGAGASAAPFAGLGTPMAAGFFQREGVGSLGMGMEDSQPWPPSGNDLPPVHPSSVPNDDDVEVTDARDTTALRGSSVGSCARGASTGSAPGKPYSKPVVKPLMASFPPTLPPAPLTPSPTPPPQPPQQPGPTPAAGATLLVRHLPEAITQDMLSRLFTHYGATSVRPCAGGKNCAFVDFRDEAAANHAHYLLNRLRFLGKVLIVERANQPDAKNAQVKHQDQSPRVVSQAPNISSLNHEDPSSSAEPIAPKLGVDYPFPPHLEYAYPPPDGNILTNIVNALIAVPRFYTQVLHLMNKMNIPAPFRMALPTPPLPLHIPAPPQPTPPPQPSTTQDLRSADLSSDESELESSDEDGDKHKSKRAKHETIVGPAVDKRVAHEAVGVKPASLVSSELQVIKKKNPVLQIKIAPKNTQKEPPVQSMTDNELTLTHEQLEEKNFVTTEEIEKEKLPPEEILSLPMFKNYTPGNPASVLYIKNLAKDVIHDDFYYVFGSLFESTDAARSSLSIKLMQEGRMRGQAFVTFPTVELAQRALNLVHGYVFKGKPMIIQFGRNPAANKAS